MSSSSLVMLDIASLMHKIHNNLTQQHTKNWLTKRSTIHLYCKRAAEAANFDIPKVKAETTEQFFPQSARIWNELPDHVKRS